MNSVLPKELTNLIDLKNLGEKCNIKSRWELNTIFPEPNSEEKKLLGRFEKKILNGSVIETHGIKVKIDKYIDTWVAYLIICDAYEAGDIRLINRYLDEKNSVLVIGGGIGVIASQIARITKKDTTVIEANACLIEKLWETSQLNDVKFNLKHGVVIPGESSGVAKFSISKEFWSSSIRQNTWKKDKIVEVNIIDLQSELGKHYDTIFVDIEGAEDGLFKYTRIPVNIKNVFIEIHDCFLGGAATAEVQNDLWENGFRLVDSDGLTRYWRRR